MHFIIIDKWNFIQNLQISIRFEALHGGISIWFRFAVTPCVYFNYREAEYRF